LLGQHFDPVERGSHSNRLIGRPVVDHQDLEVAGILLRQNAAQGVGDEGRCVEAGHDHRYRRPSSDSGWHRHRKLGWPGQDDRWAGGKTQQSAGVTEALSTG
jgi:hypothetical protein